jgi:hypothetical protein
MGSSATACIRGYSAGSLRAAAVSRRSDARLGALLDRHEITFLSSVPSVWRLALKTRGPRARERCRRVLWLRAALGDLCGRSASGAARAR